MSIFFWLVDSDEVNLLYWNTEQKCRKYMLRICLYVILHTLEFSIALVHVFDCIYAGNYDTSTWHLTFKIIFPFDETTVRGWFAAWYLEFSISFAYSVSMTAITAYFVCCCLYIRTMCDHFRWNIELIERHIKLRRVIDNPEKKDENHFEVGKQLAKAIRIHVDIFE